MENLRRAITATMGVHPDSLQFVAVGYKFELVAEVPNRFKKNARILDDKLLIRRVLLRYFKHHKEDFMKH